MGWRCKRLMILLGLAWLVAMLWLCCSGATESIGSLAGGAALPTRGGTPEEQTSWPNHPDKGDDLNRERLTATVRWTWAGELGEKKHTIASSEE